MILAELLGLPHATLILHVEKTEAGIKVKREFEEGWFQNIELPLPAVSRCNRAATNCATRRSWASSAPRPKNSANDRRRSWRRIATAFALERISLPQKQKSTQILTGSPKEAAAALVEKLKFEVQVL